MPVDMSVRICLSGSPPLRSFLSSRPLFPPAQRRPPCLSPAHRHASNHASSTPGGPGAAHPDPDPNPSGARPNPDPNPSGAHPNPDPNPSGARPNPDPNPSGARPDPSGARPNPDPNPSGARPNPSGARPNPGGARPDPGGARPDADPDPSGGRKRVVFADRCGLDLATVHVFSEAQEQLLQFQLSEVEGAAAGRHLTDPPGPSGSGSSLVLNFSPPAADYLDLRNRLKAQQVCLETCSVQEGLLSGTIQVRNICFEKWVWVRISFDCWSSFQDVPCSYLNNIYGCPDVDTFSFLVSVPVALESSSRIEFCIQFQTSDQTFWDNNLGNNYQLVVVDPNDFLSLIPDRAAGLGVPRGRGRSLEVDCDPFGSPRTSSGLWAKWPSWCQVESSAPYW